jgi:hypothetical protein
MLCRRRSASTADAVDDAGFGLIEAVVASALLVILASALLGVITSQLRTSQSGRDRVSASSLAAREIEIVRQQFNTGDSAASTIINQTSPVSNQNPVDGGTVGSDIQINGDNFHVVRQVSWLPNGAGQSACDGGSAAAYPSVRVTVTVTWQHMNGAAPVVSQTILTPSKQLIKSTAAGYLAVKVTDAAGGPTPSVTVTAVGPAGTSTQSTDDSGCAVFRLTSSGSYTVSLSKPGYVDINGNSSPSMTTSVSIGNLQRVPMTYDGILTLNASYTTQSGFSVPSNLPPITLFNAGIQTNPSHTESVQAAGTTTVISDLWPFSGGYTLWAGSCNDADPAGSPTNGTRQAPVVGIHGSTVTAQVVLAPVRVTVLDASGDPIPGATVTAVKPTDGSPAWNSGCGASDTPLSLGTTGSSGADAGVLNASVPYGEWVFETQDGSSTGDIKVDQSGVIDVQIAES